MALDVATTTCMIGNPTLAVAGDCAAGVVFAPTVAGNRVAGIIRIGNPGDTADSPLAIEVVGDATAVNSTTTTVASSLNPSGFGQGVTLTATVTTGSSAGKLTGTVNFLDGSTALASGVALSAPATTATALTSTGVLAVGKHPISASYSGDAGHTSSSSTDPNGLGQPRPPLTQNVLEGTATSVVSSANPVLPGQSVTLTATTSALGGGGVMPDGSITFMDGTTILSNVALNANATAGYTTKLSGGVHPITATYGGDAGKDIQGSTSQVLVQTVQTATAAAPNFDVTLTPSLTLKTTQNSTVTVTLTSSAGFADSIGLGCGSLPAWVGCHFSPVGVALSANGTATDQLTIDTNDLLSGGASAMNGQSRGRGASLAGALVSFSLLFGGMLWRFRRRHTGVWNVLLAMLLAVATLLVADCSGVIVRSAAPGTYVIQITGTGTSTNVTRSQNVILIITN